MFREVIYILAGAVCGAVIFFAVTLSIANSETPGGNSSNSTGSRAVPSLKLVTVVSRHGNRGSSTDYPGDPYPMNDTNYWPYGADGLTPQGRTEMYNLGAKVRKLYSGFLPDIFHPDDLRASSTYMDRLLMSGEAFLAGLYPPTGFQVWKKGLNWQPTPIYSDSPDRTIDIMTTGCDTWYVNLYQSIAAVNEKYKENVTYINNYLQNDLGFNTTSYGSSLAFVLWDKLSNEASEGYVLPYWTKKFYPALLREYASYEYKICNAVSVEIARLMAGELYEQILDTMTRKANTTLAPDRKMVYYSGHDTSMVALQRMLGMTWDSLIGVVRPASAIIIELHQNNVTQQYYVEALYINGEKLEESPQTLNITSDFETLLLQSQKYLHVNFTEECKISNQTSSYLSSTSYTNTHDSVRYLVRG